MKHNQLDNFESFVKNSLEKHRAVYDPSDWEKLNSKLNHLKKPFYVSPWFIAASIIAIIGTTYLIATFATQVQNEKSSLLYKKDIVNLTISEHVQPETNLSKEEITNNNVKETYIKAEKEIKNNTNSSNSLKKESNSNSETNISVNEEAKIATQKDSSSSEENEFKPLDAESNNSTELIEEVTITIQEASFYMSSTECCEGATINFVAETQSNVDYLWSFDDGNYSKMENPSHLFEKAGSYKINLIIRSQIDNSIMTKSNDQLLIVNPKPKIDFEWEMNNKNGTPYTSLINLTDQGAVWIWNFGDGELSNTKDPNHTYRKKGQYLISLTVSNEQECSSTLSKEIMINNDYNLLAPTSFTPNGDGLNDYFLPAALNRLNGNFKMTIYSAIDGLIYETSNISQPWDGTNQKRGSICKEGSYIWVVKLTNEKGQTEQYKGAVLLLK